MKAGNALTQSNAGQKAQQLRLCLAGQIKCRCHQLACVVGLRRIKNFVPRALFNNVALFHHDDLVTKGAHDA